MECDEIHNLDSDDHSDDSSSSIEEVFSFTFPDDLKNDIVYCQKNLRVYLKVYEMVLSRRDKDLKMLSLRSTNTAKVLLTRHYLDEIERCVYEINAEQKLLILELESLIDEWHKELEDNDIDFDPDDTNKFISKQLLPLIKSKKFKWEPIHVIKRLNEKQLIAKYGLDNDQVLLGLNDSNTSSNAAFNILQNAQIDDNDNDGDDDDDNNDDYDDDDDDEDDIIYNNNANTNNMKYNNKYKHHPQQQQEQNNQKNHNRQSLLKRKELIKDEQVSILKPKEERFQLNRNSNYKELFSRYISERDNETVKPATRLTETSKRIFVPVSPAVNTSRLNLLQALNKAKTEKTVLINHNTNTNRNTLTSSPSLASSVNRIANRNSELPYKSKKQRKKLECRSSSNGSLEDEPLSSLSPTPSTSSSLSVSPEDSPDDNSTREEISSPVSSEEIKLEPINAEEYGQEKFLGYFGLYTHDYSNELIKKRSRRRRRNVQSNEKSDYHYGHLDIFESAEKKKKKVYLASPPIIKTYNKKRKIDPNYAANALIKASSSSSSSAERSNSSSPELEQCGICNECMNSGYRDQPLSQCDACSSLFHVDCHSGGFVNQPIEVKQRICPPCQRDKLNFIAEYQALPSDDGCDDDKEDNDDDDIKSLTNEHKKLQDNNHELLMKYKKYRNKYYDTLKSKENLIRQGDTMKAQLNYYFDIVKTFKRDKNV